EWVNGAAGWREPFVPEQGGIWPTLSPLREFFSWSSPGIKTHRTWIITPDVSTLERRWEALQREHDPDRKERLFHPDRDRQSIKTVTGSLGVHANRSVSVAADAGPLMAHVRYAVRSFDRHWIPPDSRLMSRPRTQLWGCYSEKQLYLTALDRTSPSRGPAISFCGLIPD